MPPSPDFFVTNTCVNPHSRNNRCDNRSNPYGSIFCNTFANCCLHGLTSSGNSTSSFESISSSGLSVLPSGLSLLFAIFLFFAFFCTVNATISFALTVSSDAYSEVIDHTLLALFTIMP